MITLASFFSLGIFMLLCLVVNSARQQPAPAFTVFVHALVGVLGTALFLFSMVSDSFNSSWMRVLFAVIAIGGFVMMKREHADTETPKWVAVLHGVAALTVFAAIMFYAAP